MRGALIARLGDPGSGRNLLEAATAELRRGGRSPRPHEAGRLQLRMFGDADHGPFLDSAFGSLIVAHGAEPQPLAITSRVAPRFAMLEWDGTVLRASRDAFGQVPLFYRLVDEALWLCTEVAPLKRLAPARPDLTELAALAAGVRSVHSTGWVGIERVLPGAVLEARPDLSLRSRAWWRPEERFGSYRGSRAEAAAEFRERFTTAVKRCSPDATGILLSGGLDSSAVAVAAGTLPEPKPALMHVVYPTMPSCDEAAYAQAAADAAGAQLTRVEGDLSPWDPVAETRSFDLAPAMTLPIGAFETGMRSLLASGIGTVMDGHDGDGALGRFRGVSGLLALHGHLVTIARLRQGRPVRQVTGAILADLIPPELRLRRLRHRPPLDHGEADYFSGPVRERCIRRDRWQFAANAWREDELAAVTPELTVVMEEMEMIANHQGTDLRHPFADPDLIRLLISLPFEVKIEPTRSKVILRDGLAGLLPDLVARRLDKTVFQEPLDQRVSPAACLELIQSCGVHLPHVDYGRLFSAAEKDITGIRTATWMRLARAHAFATH